MAIYLENIIGTTYAANPEVFVICSLIFVWFVYQFMQLIYNILGYNK